MSDRAIEALVLLDRSWSMNERRADHEGGLRAFLLEMQSLAGDVRMTFVRFDSQEPCEVVFEGRAVGDVRESDLTLVPRGGTPLLDAVGMTLTRAKERLKGSVDDVRVIAMIITDGLENQSSEWTKERVKALVEEREAAGWKVLYLAANVDEFAEASAIGITRSSTLGYGGRGTGQMYNDTTRNVRAATASFLGGQSWAASASRGSKGARAARIETSAGRAPGIAAR